MPRLANVMGSVYSALPLLVSGGPANPAYYRLVYGGGLMGGLQAGAVSLAQKKLADQPSVIKAAGAGTAYVVATAIGNTILLRVFEHGTLYAAGAATLGSGGTIILLGTCVSAGCMIADKLGGPTTWKPLSSWSLPGRRANLLTYTPRLKPPEPPPQPQARAQPAQEVKGCCVSESANSCNWTTRTSCEGRNHVSWFYGNPWKFIRESPDENPCRDTGDLHRC
jgi:hypothetical protein